MNSVASVQRRSILVLAYSISPVRGSEYSVGWNYVSEMARDNDLIVLYGLAGDHMGDVAEVENSAICRGMPNVQFIAVRPNVITNLLNVLNRKGVLVYTFYFAYKLWHKQAYRVARQIVETQPVDIIHYLCPIGYREPGYLWKINKPYIWGPIGGVKNHPVGLALQKSLYRGFLSALRNAANTLQFRYSPRVRSALARADLLLTSTSETRQAVLDSHGIQSVHLPENAIKPEMLCHQRTIEVLPGERVNIVWVGRIDENKSLDILLTALSRVKSTNWYLYVIGSGPSADRCIRMTTELEVADKVTWVGAIPREAVSQYYRKAHLHAITSMMEANTTVLFEAMSFGIPTITLDHCGMRDTVCNKCGVKVPLTSHDETIKAYASKLELLISNPKLIMELSNGVIECSRKVTWDQRKLEWEVFYNKATENWRARQRPGRS